MDDKRQNNSLTRGNSSKMLLAGVMPWRAGKNALPSVPTRDEGEGMSGITLRIDKGKSPALPRS